MHSQSPTTISYFESDRTKFKIEMKKEDVKNFKTKIKTPNNSNAIEYNYDTILQITKGVNYTLVFFQKLHFRNEIWNCFYFLLNLNLLYWKQSRIRVGDDKMKIIETYKDYDFLLLFHYEDDGQGNFKGVKPSPSFS